jgi:acyl-CoA hydrolase
MPDAKRVSDSRTQQVQIVMARDINGYGRLFGGRLLEWIDVVAGVVARRHCECNVTTAAIDNLQFRSPARVDSTLCLIGQLTHVGKTSMEVRVDSFVEDLSGSRTLINRAYLVMVALDGQERPASVPGLILETDEERREWEAGERRRQLRAQRRRENY